MQAKGILFDLDGTLVNSLPAVERCWLVFADRHKLNHSYVLKTIHGRKAIDNIKLFLPNKPESFIEQEYRWMEQLETQDIKDIDEISGASHFLRQLSSLNIPWGIVTSGTKKVANSRFGILNVTKPKVFITGEMVINTKPAPDGYLQAANLLGLPADQCIVFEDSKAGIESAFNAQCQIISVNCPNSFDNNCMIHIDSFDELVIKKLNENDFEILKSNT